MESLLQYSRVKAVWIDIPDLRATDGEGGDVMEERTQ
jgi:hypothetical protein